MVLARLPLPAHREAIVVFAPDEAPS